MVKNILIFIFFCLNVCYIYGQSKNSNFTPHLWIKNDFVLNSNNSLNGYSPISLIPTINESLLKAKLGKNNSIYVVYKSNSSEAEQLIRLYSATTNDIFSTKTFTRDTKLNLKKVNNNGAIISYNFRKSRKEDLSVIINNNFKDKSTGIYEIIIFNDRLSKKQKKSIEAYLAIKYGISISDVDSYFDENENKLWNSDDKDFNNGLFGIGRNDFFRFFNNRSIHSTDSLLTIQYSPELIKSRSDIKGFKNLKKNEILLIGSNGKNINFKDYSDGEILEKVWKAHSNIDFNSVDLLFDTAILGIDTLSNSSKIKLVINPEANSFNEKDKLIYKEGSFKNGKLVFNNLNLDLDKNRTGFFTLFKEKQIQIETSFNVLEKCFTGNKLHIKIFNGTPPYKISLNYSDTNEVDFNVFEDSSLILSNLKSLEFSIKILDSKENTYFEKIKLDDSNKKSSLSRIELPKEFIIDSGLSSIDLTPTILNTKDQHLNFLWEKSGRSVSNSMTLKNATDGTYKLHVSDNSGCYNTFETVVFKENNQITNSEEWQIYPNPINSGEQFNITFNFNEPTEVKYVIYSNEGKIIKQINLGILTSQTVQEKILYSGVYRILALYRNTSQIKTIIIN